MDRTTRVELEQLAPRILAAPCQQFGGNEVVLRARFGFQLAGILPPRTQTALASLCCEPLAQRFGTIPVVVDLFQPSTCPKYGIQAVTLSEEQGLSLTASESPDSKPALDVAQPLVTIPLAVAGTD